MNVRVAADVEERVRESSPGYETRVKKLLRETLKQESFRDCERRQCRILVSWHGQAVLSHLSCGQSLCWLLIISLFTLMPRLQTPGRPEIVVLSEATP